MKYINGTRRTQKVKPYPKKASSLAQQPKNTNFFVLLQVKMNRTYLKRNFKVLATKINNFVVYVITN